MEKEIKDPTVLGFALDEEQTNTVRMLCKRFSLAYRAVQPEEYAEPLGALCGLYEPFGNFYEGEALPEAVLFFAGCSDDTLQKFVTLLRRADSRRPELLACLTDTNADWLPTELFSQLYAERIEMRNRMAALHAGENGHHHHHHGEETEHTDGTEETD